MNQPGLQSFPLVQAIEPTSSTTLLSTAEPSGTCLTAVWASPSLAAERLSAKDVDAFVDDVIQRVDVFESAFHLPSTYSLSGVLARDLGSGLGSPTLSRYSQYRRSKCFSTTFPL